MDNLLFYKNGIKIVYFVSLYWELTSKRKIYVFIKVHTFLSGHANNVRMQKYLSPEIICEIYQ